MRARRRWRPGSSPSSRRSTPATTRRATSSATWARSGTTRTSTSGPSRAFHEGCLGGALTEVQSLAGLADRVGLLDPKAELYRLIRIALWCQAARLGIAAAAPWEVLDGAVAADPRRRAEYETLGRAF